MENRWMFVRSTSRHVTLHLLNNSGLIQEVSNYLNIEMSKWSQNILKKNFEIFLEDIMSEKTNKSLFIKGKEGGIALIIRLK